MKKISIPIISDEELMRRYLKIKPVADVHGTKYWLRDYSLKEMKDTSYFWTIIPDKREPVGEQLSNHTHYDFECFHRCGFPGFFKPSIAEVLAQIPEDIFEHYSIDAFEIIQRPTCADDLNRYKDATKQGFHVSTVRLYLRITP